MTLEAAPLELEQDRGLERPAAMHPAVDARTARRAYVNEDFEKPTRTKTLVPFLSSTLYARHTKIWIWKSGRIRNGRVSSNCESRSWCAVRIVVMAVSKSFPGIRDARNHSLVR